MTDAVEHRADGLFQGTIVTAAGISSGIDMALARAARIAGDDCAQAIQLGLEYDPEPPFSAGSPEKAPPHIVEGVRARMRVRLAETGAHSLQRHRPGVPSGSRSGAGRRPDDDAACAGGSEPTAMPGDRALHDQLPGPGF